MDVMKLGMESASHAGTVIIGTSHQIQPRLLLFVVGLLRTDVSLCSQGAQMLALWLAGGMSFVPKDICLPGMRGTGVHSAVLSTLYLQSTSCYYQDMYLKAGLISATVLSSI